jgi:hypothetical protein
LTDVSKVLAASIIREFALIMETVSNSETSVNFYVMRRRIPEGYHFHDHERSAGKYLEGRCVLFEVCIPHSSEVTEEKINQ